MPIPQQLVPYSAKLGFPGSETLAKIFAILYDDPDSIAVAGAMPGSVREIAAKTGLDDQRVRDVVNRLLHKGAISHVLNKGEYYRLFPAMIELRDAVVVCPDYTQEFFELWDKLIREEMPLLVPLFKALNLPPLLRVIPIEEGVESSSRVLDAESALDRGVGERLSTEEALRRLALAEEAGLVHTTRNNIKDDYFLCNCCPCCCTAMFLHNEVGYTESYAPSRFGAVLDIELCLGPGCGVCKTKCPFKAISLDGAVTIDSARCFGCGNCAHACPVEAITLKEVRPPEFIRRT